MAIQWSDFALQSLEDIIIWYEVEADRHVADSIAARIFTQIEKMETFPMSAPVSEIFPGTRKVAIKNLPYVAFIRPIEDGMWKVVDIVHTARKLPKSE
ncbi:MAG: type II toxin-antitoxin system RelE/ParE family toxin [Rhodoferax sp.]|jgi:plasmid stabilization system protein ParE|nr:type II toxin-antitoxin system RelE/ParE family toxin [Rhodoferax sp.]